MGDIKREATSEEEEEAAAEVDMWRYIFGFVEMAVVKCGIELGIADAIESHGKPMTLSDLSSALGCVPSQLHRIMRFLVHRRIFKVESTSQGSICYVQTPLSNRLMRHGEKGMAAFVLLESSPVMLAPWHGLSARVLGNGASPFEAAHGQDLWSYAGENSGHSKLFNDAMACDARVVVSTVINRCPEVLDGLGSLVDVGGGDGTALSILVKACPWIRGINFDLPHVVSVAPKCVGVEHVGGDMFDTVPKAHAAYLMWVLHDWDDDECIQILRKCREAIPEDKGKVIIVEAVIEEKDNDKLKDVIEEKVTRLNQDTSCITAHFLQLQNLSCKTCYNSHFLEPESMVKLLYCAGHGFKPGPLLPRPVNQLTCLRSLPHNFPMTEPSRLKVHVTRFFKQKPTPP